MGIWTRLFGKKPSEGEEKKVEIKINCPGCGGRLTFSRDMTEELWTGADRGKTSIAAMCKRENALVILLRSKGHWGWKTKRKASRKKRHQERSRSVKNGSRRELDSSHQPELVRKERRSRKGIELAAEGKFEEAKVEFLKGIGHNLPYDPITEESLQVVNDVLIGSVPRETVLHIFKGALHGQNRRFKEQMEECRQGVSASPKYEHAHIALAEVYVDMQMWGDAISEYDKAGGTNSFRASVLCNLGCCFGNIGDKDQAVTLLKKAITIKPDYAEPHYNLGVVFGAKGLFDEEILEYKKAIAINPNYVKAHNNLGVSYVSKQMWDAAFPEYEKAIAIDPNYANAYYNLGTAYGNRGLWDKAIPAFKKAVELSPDDANAHFNLAAACYYKDQYDLAIKHYDRAVQMGHARHPALTKALKPYRK